MADAEARRKLLPWCGELLQFFPPLGFELTERLVDEFFQASCGGEICGLGGYELIEILAAEEVSLGDEIVREPPGIEIVPLAGPAAVVAGKGLLFGHKQAGKRERVTGIEVRQQQLEAFPVGGVDAERISFKLSPFKDLGQSFV